MAKDKHFATEAELVAGFCACMDPALWARNPDRAPKWIQYHETAGWDLLLVHAETGEQIGLEAKLSLNPKVLEQALPGRWADAEGPDYRAVLVPEDGLQHHVASLARHLGIVVITVRRKEGRWSSVDVPMECGFDYGPGLPRPHYDDGVWPHWCPAKRCRLPDYVPDVTGGHAAPTKLSEWKIKAIKLMIILERCGYVTRADMKALGISPTRWTDHWNGFLSRGSDGGYVRNGRTPDLKTQHPTNWSQIEADYPAWSKLLPATINFGTAA